MAASFISNIVTIQYVLITIRLEGYSSGEYIHNTTISVEAKLSNRALSRGLGVRRSVYAI